MGYRLALRAKADLIDIANYTAATWGEEQEELYINRLFQRFEWLAENPETGRLRLDIGPGYRSYLEGRHQIFYQITHQHIDILGIPHAARDIDSYFNP